MPYSFTIEQVISFVNKVRRKKWQREEDPSAMVTLELDVNDVTWPWPFLDIYSSTATVYVSISFLDGSKM